MLLNALLLLMTAIAALTFLIPLSRVKTQVDDVPREGLNTLVFRDRLREIEDDLAGGRLDVDTHAQLKRELERSLLADVDGAETKVRSSMLPASSLVMLVVLIPLVSLAIYAWKGQRSEVDAWLARIDRWQPLIAGSLKGVAISEEQGRDLSNADYIRVLQRTLQGDVDNIEGWYRLGYAYMQVGLPQYAETAFRRALAQAPDNADLELVLLESRMAQNEGALDDAGMSELAALLRRQPDNAKARMMLGMASFMRGDYATAVDVWTSLLKGMPEGSEGAGILKSSIARAEQKLHEPAVPSSAPTLNVSVTVDAALAGSFPKPAFLMIYAKQVGGMPMPVAIRKLPFGSAQVTVDLTDKEAVAPMAKLSTSKIIKVFARLSQTGSAMPQQGDVSVESAELTVKPGAQHVDLTLAPASP